MKVKNVNNKKCYIVDYNKNIMCYYYDKNIMCYYCYIEYDEGFSVGFKISINKNSHTLNDETIIRLIKKSISKHWIPHIKNIRYSFVGRFKDGKFYE